MAFSENVNHLVHTVDNVLISIGALNTDDSEAIESMLPHGVTKVSHERSAEHDVAGMTAKMDSSQTVTSTRIM